MLFGKHDGQHSPASTFTVGSVPLAGVRFHLTPLATTAFADAGYASGKATSAVARSIGAAAPSAPPVEQLLGCSERSLTLLVPAITTAAALIGWLAAPHAGSAAATAAVVGFAAMVARLTLALSSVVSGSGGSAALDRVLLGSFGVFLFVAWCLSARRQLSHQPLA